MIGVDVNKPATVVLLYGTGHKTSHQLSLPVIIPLPKTVQLSISTKRIQYQWYKTKKLTREKAAATIEFCCCPPESPTASRMVAPVRETAAQLFAVATLQLDPCRLRQAAELLFELTAATEWQARHGAFCGLESICAVAVAGDGPGGKGGEICFGKTPREAGDVLSLILVVRTADQESWER